MRWSAQNVAERIRFRLIRIRARQSIVDHAIERFEDEKLSESDKQ
jgi:hypothetical protein